MLMCDTDRERKERKGKEDQRLFSKVIIAQRVTFLWTSKLKFMCNFLIHFRVLK